MLPRNKEYGHKDVDIDGKVLVTEFIIYIYCKTGEA